MRVCEVEKVRCNSLYRSLLATEWIQGVHSIDTESEISNRFEEEEQMKALESSKPPRLHIGDFKARAKFTESCAEGSRR